jgi:beta-1,4-mannosyl-glycoprotein beta-1,4-N-acetylglucosaminyltransferase
MKLYDCSMYFDEDLMLDLRLNVLNEHVDKFIIAEATRDHAGKEKKLNFDYKNFPKFKDKIKYLVIEDLPINVKSKKKNWSPNHWRDQYQRNSLSRGFNLINEDDLIMISDIDEIPDPKKLSEFKIKNKYACFMQRNFQSKLNLLNISNKYWMGTKICQKKYLKSPQWLRNIKTKKRPFWKFYKPKEPQLILDGGWHFSFLKKPDGISKKIKAYSHQEFYKDEFVDEEKIAIRIKNNVDLFDRDIKYKKIQIDVNFPEYVLKNKDKFKEWIA